MSTAFSCVVDGSPRFEWQAVVLISSLVRCANIPATDLFVHTTPTVSDEFRRYAIEVGVNVVSIEPFEGAHGYCNKLRQTCTPFPHRHDRIVLCDCDLFFLGPVDLRELTGQASGRIVDRPNPPLEILTEIYAQAGVTMSACRPVSVPRGAHELTSGTNWNGGLYVFTRPGLQRIRETWHAHAQALLADIAILGRYRNHVDQISCALALDELQMPWSPLPDHHNVPTHLEGLPAMLTGPPMSIHYHDKMDEDGFIESTGNVTLDLAIDRANRTLANHVHRTIGESTDLHRVFSSWQSNKAAAA